jgi:hypothetical protein
MGITMDLMMLYNTDSPKRGSSDIENVMYNVTLYTTSTTGLFYLSGLFCATRSSGCTVGWFVGPDSEVRPRQTRCYVEQGQLTSRNSLGQPAKCNGGIIDSKIQYGSIYHDWWYSKSYVHSATLAWTWNLTHILLLPWRATMVSVSVSKTTGLRCRLNAFQSSVGS